LAKTIDKITPVCKYCKNVQCHYAGGQTTYTGEDSEKKVKRTVLLFRCWICQNIEMIEDNEIEIKF